MESTRFISGGKKKEKHLRSLLTFFSPSRETISYLESISHGTTGSTPGMSRCATMIHDHSLGRDRVSSWPASSSDRVRFPRLLPRSLLRGKETGIAYSHFFFLFLSSFRWCRLIIFGRCSARRTCRRRTFTGSDADRTTTLSLFTNECGASPSGTIPRHRQHQEAALRRQTSEGRTETREHHQNVQRLERRPWVSDFSPLSFARSCSWSLRRSLRRSSKSLGNWNFLLGTTSIVLYIFHNFQKLSLNISIPSWLFYRRLRFD